MCIILLPLLCVHFTSFSCLTDLATVSSTRLNNSRYRIETFLVPDFRENALKFFLIRYNIDCSFLHIIMVRVFFGIPANSQLKTQRLIISYEFSTLD